MSNENGHEAKTPYWTDPDLQVETIKVVRTDKATGEKYETIQKKRVTPTIDAEQLIVALLSVTNDPDTGLQEAIEATGLPADVIDQRVKTYDKKLRDAGYNTPDFGERFVWLGRYREFVRAPGGGGGGRKAMDLGALADLLNLGAPEPKAEEASE
jgi:hypothetical protein